MKQNQKEKHSLWSYIRRFFGLYRNPPYVEERLREADMRSAMILCVVVGCIEIGMLIRYIITWVVPGEVETLEEFFHYTGSYWILLGACVALLIYACLYLSGKAAFTKNLSRLFTFLFFALGIYFGITTSLKDFSRGRMVTCFLTMIMYVTVICIIRPIVSLALTGINGFLFYYLLNHFSFDKEGNQLFMSEGDTINYVTFFITLIILELSVYFQRYREAVKSYHLELAAITDDLTGLPNMRKFEEASMEYVRKSLSRGETPYFLVFDVTNFHTYNDRFHYSGGDQLLIETGRLITEEFPGEPLARCSDDVFAVVTTAKDYCGRADHLRNKLKELYPTETYLDLKTGAYRATEKLRDSRHAVDRARYAMQQYKNRTDLLFVEYDEKLRNKYRIRQYVLNNIEKAVKEGYIKVYYQPVIRSEDGKLCGTEALARWDDPEMGFLSPGQFIPILEEARQIHKLDRCIYDMVCKNLRRCLDEGLPALPTSMNFSRLDFELMDAVGELEALVEKYRIPKDLLHVEITESALSEDVDLLQRCITELHSRGYVIWLDDFGSGYSSMNVLKDFDFDLLKIDMVFLRNAAGNEKAYKVINSILNLANELDMMTLTEGVENEEAVSFLKQAGCGKLQGYYYGKPMPYEDLLAKIEDGTFSV